MSKVLQPKTVLQVTIDNLTGKVEFSASQPVPFPLVATVFAQVVGQLGAQAASQAAAPAGLVQNGKQGS